MSLSSSYYLDSDKIVCKRLFVDLDRQAMAARSIVCERANLARLGNGYHRDNLRAELLGAAREWVREHGHPGLSMRTLAQRVGVSHGAPYHHFPDKRALLLALALNGYAELEAAAANISSEVDSPEQMLIEMCKAYVAFAVSQPRLVDLMYESELTTPFVDPALLEHQDALRENLVKVLRMALPSRPEVELSMRVLALWSTVYGFASLRRRQAIEAFEPPNVEKDEIALFVVTVAVHAALRG